MRNRTRRRWLFWMWTVTLSMTCGECLIKDGFVKQTEQTNSSSLEASPSSAFSSPRMDYEHWTPIGRGDPLKNDPTFDYVPPVLEHVHYWQDSNRKSDSEPLATKKEILVLGVSSKRPSNHNTSEKKQDISSTKYHQNQYQRHYYNYLQHRKSLQKFRNQVPYTILMPPPPKLTTEPSITFQKSKLIFQSSSTISSDQNYLTDSSVQVTWRTPLPYNEYKNTPLMKYKGKVEDATADVSNTYVNINKPKPPELMQADTNNLVELLKKESVASTGFFMNVPRATTTPKPTTTTNANHLTTDPLFKHYKQPAEPLRGPMYFVIQGHSKVKTYGPAKTIFGIKIQDTNDISNEEFPSKDPYRVKHLHVAFRKPKEETSKVQRAGKSLKTLSEVVRGGVGAIDISEVQETVVQGGFAVGPAELASEEVYVKGTVEEDKAEQVTEA